jgi:hypothetical protein
VTAHAESRNAALMARAVAGLIVALIALGLV